MGERPKIEDWICEKCGETFAKKDMCKEHEDKCKGGFNV